ncbi:MAG: UDP-N-acetylmuramate dehydrogenase [Candidatus Pacebacteria bacterium]|jgi:UDP-N-acetylmuramate dehydrogenase|nr:UDP-N-acetylmuramate dehydrogenase [Candidatus Paceibacterota bacterium]
MKTENMPENIKGNIPLKDYSTFKMGGAAKYFCTVKNEEETKAALDFAITKQLRVFVIGRGSNLLISDDGFDGLVLKIEDSSVKSEATKDGVVLNLGAGNLLTKLALDFQKESIGGLEWTAGIPATLGGAICSNAGANGKEISESVREVRALEMELAPEKYLESYALRSIKKDECAFAYRKSLFKDTKKFIILGATLFLSRGDSDKAKKEIEKNLENRRQKQPIEYPNAGSTFKNPVLSEEQKDKLSQKCPHFADVCKNSTVPAGWLIEQAGLKGKKIGGVMVSEKHANFIVNTGEGKAEDVVILISLIKQKIRIKFSIQLHEEIEYVGF